MNRRAFLGMAGLSSLGVLTSSFELRPAAAQRGKKVNNFAHQRYPLEH